MPEAQPRLPNLLYPTPPDVVNMRFTRQHPHLCLTYIRHALPPSSSDEGYLFFPPDDITYQLRLLAPEQITNIKPHGITPLATLDIQRFLPNQAQRVTELLPEVILCERENVFYMTTSYLSAELPEPSLKPLTPEAALIWYSLLHNMTALSAYDGLIDTTGAKAYNITSDSHVALTPTALDYYNNLINSLRTAFGEYWPTIETSQIGQTSGYPPLHTATLSRSLHVQPSSAISAGELMVDPITPTLIDTLIEYLSEHSIGDTTPDYHD